MPTLIFPVHSLGGVSGSTIELTVSDSVASPSAHSGRPIRAIQAHCAVFGPDARTVVAALVEVSHADGGVAASGPDDLADTRWRIDQRQMTYNGDENPNTRYTYRFELAEIEMFALSELRVGDISLRPSRYDEKLDNSAIIIDARVRLSGDDDAELRRLITESDAPYHTVTRVGVNETPLKMRFGRIKWMEQGNEREYALILVQDAYDRSPTSRKAFLPDLNTAFGMAARTRGLFNALFATMVAKGVLADADVKAIRDTAARTARVDVFELDKVSEFDDD